MPARFEWQQAIESKKESAPQERRIDMGSGGELNQMSYLASLRGEGRRHWGEGKWRDKEEFMIDAIKYPIYI